MTDRPLVYVILVNFNGWHHTIECLESLFRQDYKDFRVIVIDNASTDGSVDMLRAWAEGRVDVYVDPSNPMRTSNVCKPISYSYLGVQDTSNLSDFNLVFIRSWHNVGFAGANNLGIRVAMSDYRCRYVWLLNNDTVVTQDALTLLVKQAEEFYMQGTRVGIIGSKLIYYHDPKRLNAIGGRYYKWIGLPRQVGMMEIDQGQYDKDKLKIDYIVGASMFVCRDFIVDVGPMYEDYFLYYEELDWVCRGKQKGWAIALCPDSVVYHKEGATIGSNKVKKERSSITDYYVFRNRVLFTRRFYPYCLVTVIFSSLVAILVKVPKCNLKAMLKGLWDGLCNKRGAGDV